jgi:hypothetical protein
VNGPLLQEGKPPIVFLGMSRDMLDELIRLYHEARAEAGMAPVQVGIPVNSNETIH